MENKFDSAKWIREFKTAIFEEKENYQPKLTAMRIRASAT